MVSEDMQPLLKEFNDRNLRIKSRKLLSSSELCDWPFENWIGWLHDGLEIFCSDESTSLERATAFSPYVLPQSRGDRPDAHSLAACLQKIKFDEEATSRFGQAIIEACDTKYNLEGGGVDSAAKADFLLRLGETISPDRSLELIENILRLHDEGWLNIVFHDALVSNCVYVTYDHKDEEKAPLVAGGLKDFVRDYGSHFTQQEFARIPVVT